MVTSTLGTRLFPLGLLGAAACGWQWDTMVGELGSTPASSTDKPSEPTTTDATTDAETAGTTAAPLMCEEPGPWQAKQLANRATAAALTIDPCGDFVVAGRACPGACSEPDQTDIVIASYRPEASEPTWINRFPSDGEYDIAQDIALDAAGDLYVTGIFQGTTTIDGQDYMAVGDFDAFVVKLSPAGDIRWVYTSRRPSSEAGNALLVHPVTGQIIVAGYCDDFRDFWLLAVDQDGKYAHDLCLDNPPYMEELRRIAIDDDRRIYTAGNFGTSLEVSPNVGLTSEGMYDVAILSLTADDPDEFEFIWATNIGGETDIYNTDDGIGALLVDGTDLYVAGHCVGFLQKGGVGGSDENCGDHGVFVARLQTADGTLEWRRAFSTSTSYGGRASGLALRDGGILVSGSFAGDFATIPMPLQSPLLTAYVLVMSANGAVEAAYALTSESGTTGGPLLTRGVDFFLAGELQGTGTLNAPFFGQTLDPLGGDTFDTALFLLRGDVD